MLRLHQSYPCNSSSKTSRCRNTSLTCSRTPRAIWSIKYSLKTRSEVRQTSPHRCKGNSSMKVCLVGTAPGSRLIAPYKDESYEIWGCSAGNSQSQALPRITKWFELHALCDMMAAENVAWCAPYFGWLRAQPFPVYMQENNEYVPGAIVFPHKALMDEFGPNPKKNLANWFTSTVPWMMAFAIVQMREGDEIAIIG